MWPGYLQQQAKVIFLATYKQIQEDVKARYGWVPKTYWIAHVKELNGLPVSRAPNRVSEQRQVPCPNEKRPAIEESMRAQGMLSNE